MDSPRVGMDLLTVRQKIKQMSERGHGANNSPRHVPQLTLDPGPSQKRHLEIRVNGS